MLIGLVCLKPNARHTVRPATGTKPCVTWGLIGTRYTSDFLNLKITFRHDGLDGVLAIRPGLDWQGLQRGGTVVLQLSLELACPVGMPGKNWRAVLTHSLRGVGKPLSPLRFCFVLSLRDSLPMNKSPDPECYKGAELGLLHLMVALRNTTELQKAGFPIGHEGCRLLEPQTRPS